MNKLELINYLNDYLKIKDYVDWSKNWLQVDCDKKDITKIWYAVDANSYIFDLAKEEWVDMIIVHHWLFWWFDPTITWIHYNRVSKLIKSNIWLYTCHIPLDAHPVIWNNAWIINHIITHFGITDFHKEQFWEYKWNIIWYWIKFENWINIMSVVDMLESKLWFIPNLLNFGNKEEIKSIWAISWEWGDYAPKAHETWYDLYITWEWAHHEICTARELSQSILLWWHRETETIWVQLLAQHLNKNFGIEIVFLDKKY